MIIDYIYIYIYPPAPRATRLWNRPIRIHQALSLKPMSLHYTFLIHQAFKPPVSCFESSSPSVSDPPVLESLVLNPPRSEDTRILGSYRATPPRQKPLQATPPQTSLPICTLPPRRPRIHQKIIKISIQLSIVFSWILAPIWHQISSKIYPKSTKSTSQKQL